MSRRLALLAVVVAAALTISVSIAVAGLGNSAAANSCKNGGWMNLVRADQTPFADQGACVSYATKGGTPAPPTTTYADARAECSRMGGTFDTPGFDVLQAGQTGFVLLYSCNDWPRSTAIPAPSIAWTPICQADAGYPTYNWGLNTTSNNPPSTQRTGVACYRGPLL